MIRLFTSPFNEELGAAANGENPWKAVDNKVRIGAKLAIPGFLALTASSVGIALLVKQFSSLQSHHIFQKFELGSLGEELVLSPVSAAIIVASMSGIVQPLLIKGVAKVTDKPTAQKVAIGMTALFAGYTTLGFEPCVEEFVFTVGSTAMMGLLREKTNKQWQDDWTKKQKFCAYLESLVAPFVFATLVDLSGSLDMAARLRIWPS